MTEKGSEGRGLRERILNLKEQRISSGNSTWDDCEPIVYLLKRDVLAALDAEAAQQTPHAAGGELRDGATMTEQTQGKITPLTYEQEVHALLSAAEGSTSDLLAYFRTQIKQEHGDARKLTEKCIAWKEDDLRRLRALIPQALARRDALAAHTSPAAGEGRIVAGQSDVALAHSAFAKGALNGMQGEPASRLGWPEQGASRIETQSVPREAAEHPQPAPEGRE